MADGNNSAKRRSVLKAAGLATASTGLMGMASAKDATVEVNVGYENDRGRGAAVSAAKSVSREFNFDALTMTVARKAVSALENNPNIRYVEENGTMEALAQSTPWGVDRVDAEVAHANGDTGAGADIAILDTGIDSDHPDLAANLGSGKSFVSCKGGPSKCGQPWDDDNEHGTHCAGTAGAVNNSQGVVGVSTQATLHAVKVLDKRGSGTYSDIAAGVEYTADQGWDVGSMSLGGSSSSQTLQDACQYAVDNGVFLVAAAGNSGPCTDCVGYPAAYDTVMAVGATDSSDNVASFSSTGPEVEIAAPGVNINSTVPGGSYAEFNGTSMACPHVAGAAGQLAANGYTNTEIRSQLNSTAEDIGHADNETGNGLLDVAAALGHSSTNDL